MPTDFRITEASDRPATLNALLWMLTADDTTTALAPVMSCTEVEVVADFLNAHDFQERANEWQAHHVHNQNCGY